MARTINLTFKGKESTFSITKLDRAKLYGRKRRIPVGPDGEKCVRASLSAGDGRLLQKGMTGQGYFSGGNWVPRAELTGIDSQGKEVEAAPSTLGVPVPLKELSIEAILDLRISSVYLLDPKEVDPTLEKALKAGKAMGFDFNYRKDFQLEEACLISNKEGFFALIGRAATPEWMKYKSMANELTEEEEAEEEEDLDFEMF